MASKIYFLIYVILGLFAVYISIDNFEKFKAFPHFKIIAAFSIFTYMFSKLFTQEIKIGRVDYIGSPTIWIFGFLFISWCYSFLIIPDILNTYQVYVFTGILAIVNAFYINFLVQKEIGHKINHKKNAIFLVVFNLYIWITYFFFSF